STLPTVVITGASTGIGAVYADRFARRGHDLILVARDLARLQALAERLRADYGVAAEPLKADLADPAQLAGLERLLRDDARIGVLVNNAGLGLFGAFEATPMATVREIFDTNTFGAMAVCQAAI
ncbi:SDR family NAD(P)-dependent oxidoreductase, partial [Streptomyces sp. S9]|nr:SDR family NAD(P)-dependent oxidoreductase [Streptomyces sp. S9]